MRWGIAFVSCALSLGCAAQTNKGPMYAGDARGRASMEALPSLDVTDAALSPEMQMARMLSAESLELQAPRVPENTTAAELTDWSDHELKAWLREKQRRAEVARKELDLAAAQNHRQRILAGALLGLVFEDVARGLLLLPAPAELADEPEVSEIFREVMLSQAAPYLLHAELAYKACAGNAQGLASMGHWTSFCSDRADGLPARAEPDQGEETTVTVERTAAR